MTDSELTRRIGLPGLWVRRPIRLAFQRGVSNSERQESRLIRWNLERFKRSQQLVELWTREAEFYAAWKMSWPMAILFLDARGVEEAFLDEVLGWFWGWFWEFSTTKKKMVSVQKNDSQSQAHGKTHQWKELKKHINTIKEGPVPFIAPGPSFWFVKSPSS